MATTEQVGSGPCGLLANSVFLWSSSSLLLSASWHLCSSPCSLVPADPFLCLQISSDNLPDIPLNFLGLPGELLLNSLHKVVQNTLNIASDRDRCSWTKEKRKNKKTKTYRKADVTKKLRLWDGPDDVTVKRTGWRPVRCKGKDWAANGKATEAGKGGHCRLEKGKAHTSATPTPWCCWAGQEMQLQGTPSGPPGNSLLTWTHSRLLLRLLRRSDFYGSTPSSSGFTVPSATSGPQACLRLTSMTVWHSQQSSLCLGQPGREGVTPAPSFCLGLTQKQGLSTRPDPSLVVI